MQRSRVPTPRQLRYLTDVLSGRELLIIRWLTGLIIICLTVLGVRYYQRHVTFEPIVSGSYVEALVGTPQYINPILAQTNDVDRDLTTLTYAGLFTVENGRELVPDLVSEYEISEDHQTYALTLRDGVRWHDGIPVTAADVLFTIERIQNPAYRSPILRTLQGVKAELVDERTIRLTLAEPFAPFLSTLTFGILPEHLWADVPPESVALTEYNLKPVGSGPFQFKSLTRDRSGAIKSYTLARYNDYHRAPPYLKEITFRFYADVGSATDAARFKSVEGISFVTSGAVDELERVRSLRLVPLAMPQYTAIFFNQRTGLLQERKFREALTLGLDRDRLVQEVLGGRGTVVHGPIPPGSLGYHPEIRVIPFDPARASELLEELGWKRVEGSPYRKKGDEELVFSMTTVDQPDLVATIGKIREAWERIGVNLEVHIVDGSHIQKDVIRPRDYQSLLFGEIAGFDPDPFPFWHSSQQRDPGLSLSIFFSKQADKVLEQARMTTDTQERQLKYVEFQNILADELPAIFLFSPTYTYGIGAKIKGFMTDQIVIPADRFAGITEWFVKTRRVWQ